MGAANLDVLTREDLLDASGHHGHAEEDLIVGVVDQPGLVACALAAQMVIAEQCLLERSACTFHFCGRATEQANPALLGKFG